MIPYETLAWRGRWDETSHLTRTSAFSKTMPRALCCRMLRALCVPRGGAVSYERDTPLSTSPRLRERGHTIVHMINCLLRLQLPSDLRQTKTVSCNTTGQSAPESGPGFQVKHLQTKEQSPSGSRQHTGAGPLWEGCRESRRCSRDIYPGSYITKYATYTNLKPVISPLLALGSGRQMTGERQYKSRRCALIALVCTGARWNPATFGTHQDIWKGNNLLEAEERGVRLDVVVVEPRGCPRVFVSLKARILALKQDYR